MIITIKNLQQQTFTVDFDAAKTVLQLKQQIFDERGPEYIVEKQKLIYAGVILDDARSIASYNVDKKKFIVVMLKRDFGNAQKPDDSGPSTSKAATSIVTTDDSGASKTITSGAAEISPAHKMEEKNLTDETKSVDAELELGRVASTTSVKSTASGVSLQSAGSVGSGGSESSHSTFSSGDLSGVFSVTSLQSRAESNLLMGDAYNRSVDSMVEMGYSRELVERAMRASFNNPERAVEYLIGGIPESTEQFRAPVNPTLDQEVEPEPLQAQVEAPEQELVQPFEIAADQINEIAPEDDPFFLLRNQPQFLHMRSLVYRNPDLLHAVLQQIAQTNPALLQLISENQDAFLNMLNQPIEGEENIAPVYPRRMTPGRRAQLAAGARSTSGGDGPHIRSLDTAPGSSGDGPPVRHVPGEATRNAVIPDDLTPDRAAERRAAAAAAFMRDRAAAAAAVAALTAAATAAVDRNVGVRGVGEPIRAADAAGGGGVGGLLGGGNVGGHVAGDEAGDAAGDAAGGDAAGGGAGGEGPNVRPGTPPRNLPPTAHGAGADGDGTSTIRLTPADRESIERLKALGFPEALVLQAYFACDKNEQLAANFLITSDFDD